MSPVVLAETCSPGLTSCTGTRGPAWPQEADALALGVRGCAPPDGQLPTTGSSLSSFERGTRLPACPPRGVAASITQDNIWETTPKTPGAREDIFRSIAHPQQADLPLNLLSTKSPSGQNRVLDAGSRPMAGRQGWPTGVADRGGRQEGPTGVADRRSRQEWPTGVADRGGRQEGPGEAGGGG